MLKLRKILLCNYLYIFVFIVVIIITIYRLNIKIESKYSLNTNRVIGIVDKITKKEDKITIYIKGKETLIGTMYSKENINLNLGDKVLIEGKIKEPSTNTTNYLFNYKEYLNRKNIFYLIEISSIKKIKNNSNLYYYLKQKLINHLNDNPYLYTFILGDKSYLKDNVKRSYQENGISHLFAISGMHITLLVSIISKLLGKIKITENKLFLLITLVLLIYLSIVGLSPSIVRGVLFYIMFSINTINYFYIKPANLFLMIISISLLINPNYIFDIGFQYSYLISFSLLKMSDNLNSNNYFLSLLKVSILSFIVSIPITIYNFYQINILGILYNLFFVPLVSIVIFPMSLLVLIIKPLEPIYNLLINLLENISLLLNNINTFKMVFKRLPGFIYLIYLLVIVIYLYKPKKLIIGILLLLLGIHFVIPYFDKSDYIKMIDVGQGDSILIHSNNKNILMDTGGVSEYSNNDGVIFHNTISPLLKSNGIKKLDYLILSHGDKDHLGEAKTIIDEMKVDKIYLNQGKLNYLEKELINNSKSVSKIKRKQLIILRDIKLIELNQSFEDENDSSSIFIMIYKNKKVLFTGDASKKTEEYILNTYDLPKIDILKAGHHGSKTSTSRELLKKIKPKLVLISCGKDNKFKHPSSETIKELNEFAIPYLRTDEVGTITVDLNNNKIFK